MKREDIVWQNEKRVSGALCFKDTRVPVKILTDHLKHGYTLDDFLRDFPSVSREQAQAFLDLAREQVEAATPFEAADAEEANARAAG